MSEEIKEQDLEQDDTNMYLEQIKEMKANSVSKQQYDKVLEENRNLLKSLVEGQTVSSTEDEVQPSRDIQEILTDFNNDTSNLDHIKLVMELHNKRLEQGINDFVPLGHNIQPTDEDLASAKEVEDFLNDLIATADGDPVVFNNEYQRRVKDVILPRRTK